MRLRQAYCYMDGLLVPHVRRCILFLIRTRKRRWDTPTTCALCTIRILLEISDLLFDIYFQNRYNTEKISTAICANPRPPRCIVAVEEVNPKPFYLVKAALLAILDGLRGFPGPCCSSPIYVEWCIWRSNKNSLSFPPLYGGRHPIVGRERLVLRCQVQQELQ